MPTIDVGVAIAGRDESKAMPLMDAEESPAKAISEHDASPAKTLNESSPSQPKVPSASLALLAAVQTQKENKAQEKKKMQKKPTAADSSVPVASKGKKRKAAPAEAKRCNAGYSIEWSRNNVQARTGKSGPGQNKAFKFGGAHQHKTVDAAVKAAKKWLKEIGK